MGSNFVEVLNFFFFFFRLLTQLRSQLRSQLRESSDHSSFDVFKFVHSCLLLCLLCYGAVFFFIFHQFAGSSHRLNFKKFSWHSSFNPLSPKSDKHQFSPQSLNWFVKHPGKIKMKQSGFSFETGGRTFRSVVCHSLSGTLMLKFEGFLIVCYYYHFFFHLSHSLINLLPFPLPVPLPTVQFLSFFFQNLRELQPCLGMTDSWVPETLETAFLSVLL